MKDDEFSVKIPMFGKNKYPMVQFKDFNENLENEFSKRRHETWKEHTPKYRLKAVDWVPKFIAVTENSYNRNGD